MVTAHALVTLDCLHGGVLVYLKQPRLHFLIDKYIKPKYLEHLSFMHCPISVFLWEGMKLDHVGEDSKSCLTCGLNVFLNFVYSVGVAVLGLDFLPESSKRLL